MRPRRLAAGWVLPVAGPPIRNGAILLGEDGRICSVGEDRVVPRPPDVVAEEYPGGLLLPGLVNTHTHLELTGLGDAPPEPDFAAWVRRLRETKAARGAEAFLAAGRDGLAACYAAGITTVADTGDSGAVIQALAEAGGSGIAYHEVFGPHPDQVAESLAGLQAAVERLGRYAGGRVRLGVSPHAPYTVSGPLYAATAVWAAAERLPLAVHLAESRAESELLERGTGAFAEAWRRRGIPLPPLPGRTPVQWLEQHGVLGARTLCIHLVQATPGDLVRLAARGSAAAHCPLSNRRHGHGQAPLAGLLEAGIRTGLGTDSVLSVGMLDLLAEAREARFSAGLGADQALALCTLAAAAALELEHEIGSLEPGKWGDCVILGAPEPADHLSPAEQALGCGIRDVLATYLGGRPVYRSDSAAA